MAFDVNNISYDNIKFKMADNYTEFGTSILNVNYSFEDGDFLAFAELHGDLSIVGYAIIYGFNNIFSFIKSIIYSKYI